MQTIGYIIDQATGERLRILVRKTKYGKALKLRATGSDGSLFVDESLFLNSDAGQNRLNELKSGKVVNC